MPILSQINPMNSRRRCIFLSVLSLVSSFAISAEVQVDAWQKTEGWWNATGVPAFDSSKITRQLPLVKVQANKFVDDRGHVVIFRAAHDQLPDPQRDQLGSLGF